MKMTSKLPVRKNIEPLYEIASELESHLEKSLKTKNEKNELIYKAIEFTDNLSIKNVPNKDTDSEKIDDKKLKRNLKMRLQEKDDQIAKLVERLTVLHAHNEQFAAENEKLKSQECESCKELMSKETQWRENASQLRKENQQLLDDVKMMKTLVYRLNVQLERHQDELRKYELDPNFAKINFDTNDGHHLDWGTVKAHTLGPLLNAYSEIIKEKNNLVQQYENEQNHFTGKLKDVIAENERLQSELKTLKQENEVWSTDKTRLQAQMELFRNKAEIQSKRADVTKEKLVEVLKCYEQKFQSQNLDLERLQEAYSRAKGELTALRGVQQCPSEVLAESLKEMQKLFQELSSQYDNEKSKLNLTIESQANKLKEMETKYLQFASEGDVLRKHTKSLEEQNESLLNKITQLRQSLARVRLSRESFKSRLKNTHSLNRTMEGSQRRLKSTWNDLKQVETLLQQKENHVQSVHLRYLNEIEKLTRKLQHRDETLKKVLRSSAATASKNKEKR